MTIEESLYKDIYDVIKKKAGLHEPDFIKQILRLYQNVKSSFVSTYGKFVTKFENSLKIFTKSKYVVATNTGTSALHIALKLLG